jgi:hypothetical protein
MPAEPPANVETGVAQFSGDYNILTHDPGSERLLAFLAAFGLSHAYPICRDYRQGGGTLTKQAQTFQIKGHAWVSYDFSFVFSMSAARVA